MGRRRLCVFCGSREAKLTVEDVLPLWTHRYWKRQKRPKPSAGHTHVYVNLGTGEQVRRPGELKVEAAIVCPTCNTTWMSDIQREASDRLKPMLSGHSLTLDSDDQRWVAAWGFMTACTWEFSVTQRYIPQSKRREFYTLRTEPPPDTLMWLGHVRHKSLVMTCSVVPLDVKENDTLSTRHKAYAATIGIENFILQFVGHTAHSLPFGVDRGEASSAFRDIWPQPLPPYSWPLRWSLNERGVDSAIRAFVGNPWIEV